MNLSALRATLLPPCPVLDTHVHPLDGLGPYAMGSAQEDARILLAAAQRSGVVKLCLFSLLPTTPIEPTPDECRAANDYALAMRDCAPQALLPFCYVNPMYPDAALAELERCVGRERMVGVKLWVARRATDPGLDPIMRYAVAVGVPVLQHAWNKTTGNLPGESNAGDVADLARRHPQARIIMAHLNGIGPRGLAAVADCPNLVVDTSGGDPETGLVEAAVAQLGAARVVYGSDAPIRHFGVTLGKTLGAQLPAVAKQAILWDNLARLLPPWAGVRPLAEAGA